MKIFFKLKQTMVESSWKSWAIGSVVIISLANFYQELQIEKRVATQLKDIVSVIQNAERKMQETKKIIQVNNQKITGESEKTSKKSDENKQSSQNSIHAAQKAISDMINKRMQVKKPIKEPIISEKGPHTLEDVKVMRLALEENLNKLITLRTEDILEEHIELQKQFENLLIEVFAEKEEPVMEKRT